MMLLWAFAGIPLGVYTIAQNLNVALQVQPQLLTFLSLVTWGQCLYYKKVITPAGRGVPRSSWTKVTDVSDSHGL